MQLPVGAPILSSWLEEIRHPTSNRNDAGANPAGDIHLNAVQAKDSKRLFAKQHLPGGSPGRCSNFSPRDVTDNMRRFERRHQGAIPCVETIFFYGSRTGQPSEARQTARKRSPKGGADAPSTEPGLIANEIGPGQPAWGACPPTSASFAAQA